jgi:hypothetical protein
MYGVVALDRRRVVADGEIIVRKERQNGSFLYVLSGENADPVNW